MHWKCNAIIKTCAVDIIMALSGVYLIETKRHALTVFETKKKFEKILLFVALTEKILKAVLGHILFTLQSCIYHKSLLHDCNGIG